MMEKTPMPDPRPPDVIDQPPPDVTTVPPPDIPPPGPPNIPARPERGDDGDPVV